MQGDNVVTIEETMQMAYNCFVNKDFSMAKDYSLRAMTKDTQNIQAKEIYYFICLHKQNNGRFANFDTMETAKYLAELSQRSDLKDLDILIKLIDSEINVDLQFKNPVSDKYLEELNDLLIGIRASDNVDYVYDSANKLAYISKKLQEQKESHDAYMQELETKYKPKKSWKEKLGIAWIVLIPFIILLLPGYIIVKVIMSLSGKK